MSERRMNQYRKELLYRKVNGKKIFNDYLGKIASLFPTGGRPDLLSLEETDAVLNRFKAVSAQLRLDTVRIPATTLHAELSDMKNNRGNFYVLIDEDWKCCGMLTVKDLADINVRVEFGDKILNDLIFISGDMSAAISFDFFEVAGNHLIDVKKWLEM
jgi:hypothetical protein